MSDVRSYGDKRIKSKALSSFIFLHEYTISTFTDEWVGKWAKFEPDGIWNQLNVFVLNRTPFESQSDQQNSNYMSCRITNSLIIHYLSDPGDPNKIHVWISLLLINFPVGIFRINVQ